MMCRRCGAWVVWIGPEAVAEHTRCLGCGARDTQVIDPEPERDVKKPLDATVTSGG